jgi:exodeoxyribonuclease VII large subunit
LNSPISVNELNEQIKGLLETTFCNVYVEGEVSNLTYHNSGHIYFSIKDEKSTISCVMFRGNARYLKFRLEVGQKITISGSITAYVPRGNYQLLCNKIEPSGTGALALAYEQLKTKLQIKGYFDKSIKKQLPKFPKTIYVVTSNTGAAIEDMKKVLTNRYPLAKMILIPALVQGEGSAGSIVRSIEIADNLAQNSSEHSLIIIGRGGGSIEDLWSFNEEIVADAVFNTKTPIISAVGHESDFVISDFVADIRASTPSNAIEIATPDINELRIYLDNISDEFKNRLLRIISLKEQYLFQLKKSFEQHSLTKRFELIQTNINNLNQQYRNIYAQKINFYQNQIDNIEKSFELNHPNKKTKKGFVQITKDNNIISLKEIAKDEMLQLHDTNYMVDCKVLSKIEIK